MGLFSTIGSLFTPVGSLVGGVVDTALGWAGESSKNAANLEQIRATNEAQKELAQYKYDLDLEQWHRENAYNTPKAQMERLAEAGLNPHLMYQQGSTGQAAPSPQYDMANLQAYQMDASPLSVMADKMGKTAEQVLDYYLREQKQIAELKSLEYDNDMKKAYAIKATADTSVALAKEAEIFEDTALKKIINNYADELHASQVAGQWASFENTVANTAVLEEQVYAVKADALAKEAAANLSEAQAAAARKLIQKYQKEIEALAADIALKGEQANLARQQALFTKIQAEWTDDHGPGKTWVDSLFNLPTMAVSSVIKFARRIGLHISDGLTYGSSDKSRANVSSPFTIGLKGFSTLAPGKAGAVDGFRLR